MFYLIDIVLVGKEYFNSQSNTHTEDILKSLIFVVLFSWVVNNTLKLLFLSRYEWNSFVVGQTRFRCGPVMDSTRMKGE